MTSGGPAEIDCVVEYALGKLDFGEKQSWLSRRRKHVCLSPYRLWEVAVLLLITNIFILFAHESVGARGLILTKNTSSTSLFYCAIFFLLVD